MKRVLAGPHHVALDGALQEQQREDAQDEREHPRKKQIEKDGADVLRIPPYVMPLAA